MCVIQPERKISPGVSKLFTPILEEVEENAKRGDYLPSNYQKAIIQNIFEIVTNKLTSHKDMISLIMRVPTGCGKSWIIAITAAVISKMYPKLNVLILTANNLLA
jgi:superfamily II DNA or RNA helicase